MVIIDVAVYSEHIIDVAVYSEHIIDVAVYSEHIKVIRHGIKLGSVERSIH
jgi:hypothetical protein